MMICELIYMTPWNVIEHLPASRWTARETTIVSMVEYVLGGCRKRKVMCLLCRIRPRDPGAVLLLIPDQRPPDDAVPAFVLCDDCSSSKGQIGAMKALREFYDYDLVSAAPKRLQ